MGQPRGGPRSGIADRRSPTEPSAEAKRYGRNQTARLPRPVRIAGILAEAAVNSPTRRGHSWRPDATSSSGASTPPRLRQRPLTKHTRQPAPSFTAPRARWCLGTHSDFRRRRLRPANRELPVTRGRRCLRLGPLTGPVSRGGPAPALTLGDVVEAPAVPRPRSRDDGVTPATVLTRRRLAATAPGMLGSSRLPFETDVDRSRSGPTNPIPA
jgi:hypothetical protein